MTKRIQKESCYASPQVEVIELKVEKGFATSAPGFSEYDENGIFGGGF